MSTTNNRPVSAYLLSAGFLFCVTAWAQLGIPSASPVSVPPEVPQDVLGRGTPRGTVLGFLTAARKGEDETASQYLNTRLRGKAAAILAHQLFVVLDRRLPARLNQLSDRPEGSMVYPAKPNLDPVGTINSASGDVDIVVERVDRGKAGSLWLFSSKTLDSIPELYNEVNAVSVENVIPAFLADTRIARIPLYEWFALLVGMPLLYLLTVVLNRFLRSLVGHSLRRLRKTELPDTELLPPPARLLLMAAVIRWALSKVSLPLLARQFWSSTASVITIAACVWLIILLIGWGTGYIRRRLIRQDRTGAVSVLILARWTADLLVIFGGILAGLHYFGVNPTAALAGLGVGGIAVALAAQKTLENVLAGVSLIFDQAVRVGDFLKVGDTLGTVQGIGLRSTRIRTLDRSVVSVPNGQIANVSLENISLRDKFWFRHILGLRYETTASQMRSILEGVSNLLQQHPRVERDSVRVQFLRWGACSLDVEIFAYFFERGWSHFLGIQGELLLQIMEIVQTAGARMALPSQTLYLATSSLPDGSSVQELFQTPAPDNRPVKQKEIQHDSRTDTLTGSPR
jgi:MscS family membrane protein